MEQLTGIKVTEDELKKAFDLYVLIKANPTSANQLRQQEAARIEFRQIFDKYNMSSDSGLDLETGEFFIITKD